MTLGRAHNRDTVPLSDSGGSSSSGNRRCSGSGDRNCSDSGSDSGGGIRCSGNGG